MGGIFSHGEDTDLAASGAAFGLRLRPAENDWALGPDTKATARAYGVQEEILPSVGLYVILEANWKRVAERILNWLKEKGN